MKKLLPLLLTLFIAPAFAHSDHAHDDSVSKPPKRAASAAKPEPKVTPPAAVKAAIKKAAADKAKAAAATPAETAPASGTKLP